MNIRRLCGYAIIAGGYVLMCSQFAASGLPAWEVVLCMMLESAITAAAVLALEFFERRRKEKP
jgi:hypothetical protein